jgi:hypothetical protein
MRLEGHHDGFNVPVTRYFTSLGENLLMAKVHTIEVAYCQYAAWSNLLKLFYGLQYLHGDELFAMSRTTLPAEMSHLGTA